MAFSWRGDAVILQGFYRRLKKGASPLFPYKDILLNKNALFQVYMLGTMKTQVEKLKNKSLLNI